MKFFSLLIVFGLSSDLIYSQWSALGNGIFNQGRVLYYDSTTTTLYAGGAFSIVDGKTVNGIASWDGSAWDSLGNGAYYSGVVFYITKFQSKILASGVTVDPTNYGWKWVSLWDGTSWDTLHPNLNDPVETVVKKDNDYYFGGRFTASDTTPVNYIAKLDSSGFHSLPLPSNFFSVNAISFYHDSLFIGGNFYDTLTSTNDFEVWNGSSFQSVGPASQQLNGIVNAMVEYNGELYIGGHFFSSVGNHILKWDGFNFTPVGPGVNAEIFRMKVYNGELYVSGQFDHAGSLPVSRIAKWNGTIWSEVIPFEADNYGIGDFIMVGNDLYVTGSFQTMGGVTVNNIAKYTFQTKVNESEEVDYFKIYPNPASTFLRCEFKNGSNFKINIAEISGKIVLIDNCNNFNSEIDISTLSPGIYFLDAISDQRTFRKRFIKN